MLLLERFGLPRPFVEQVLRRLKRNGLAVVRRGARIALELPDETDWPFLQVARAGRAVALVTWNLRHFPEAAGVTVLTPVQFLERFRRGEI